MATPPRLGSRPTQSSSGDSVVLKPKTSPASATWRASSSAVPRLDPNNTSSGVSCCGTARAEAARRGAPRTAAAAGLALHGRIVGATANFYPQSVRFQRQRLFDLQLVARVVDQLESLQDEPDDERRFLHGELTADACPLTVAERLERISGTRWPRLRG